MTTYPTRISRLINQEAKEGMNALNRLDCNATSVVKSNNRSPLFLHLPVNERGRDFIIGDIHGAFDMVWNGMRQVNFDGRFDRLFSVGDLIDRGKSSDRALEFLALPYVFAVKGNHDENFSSIDLDSMKILASANWNGMGWINDVSDERILALRLAIGKLPVAIQVETQRGTVGLVHADIPKGMHWDVFLDAIKAEDGSVINVALEGRDRVKSGDKSGVAGIGRLFVGHTIQWGGPKRFGNVYAIDTGATFREISKDMGSLTMANMLCRTGLLVPSSDDNFEGFIRAIDQVEYQPFSSLDSIDRPRGK